MCIDTAFMLSFRKKFPTLVIFATTSSFYFLSFTHGASAENFIERAIYTAQPCQSLHANIGIANVGVDRLKSVAINAASITIQGNTADLSLDGSLTCETSDKATLRGEVSATMHFSAGVDLQACTIVNEDVQITQTGGTFGKFIDVLKPQIISGLKAGLPQQLAKLCKQ